ncbi:hypothetical protein J3Q64DRAFT_1760913 [Phycomyces blakesleeanus]|uniref:Uncharacterized protein n=1 Tax=Phycomyces blakesleeanus TaxID=4837 RepID=A0ABR3ATK0_PHYBL
MPPSVVTAGPLFNQMRRLDHTSLDLKNKIKNRVKTSTTHNPTTDSNINNNNTSHHNSSGRGRITVAGSDTRDTKDTKDFSKPSLLSPASTVTPAIIPANIRSSRPLQVQTHTQANKSPNSTHPPVQRRSKLPVLRSSSTPTHTPPKHTSSLNDLDNLLLPKPPLTLSTSISISTSTLPARPSTPSSRIGRDKGTGRIPVRAEPHTTTTTTNNNTNTNINTNTNTNSHMFTTNTTIGGGNPSIRKTSVRSLAKLRGGEEAVATATVPATSPRTLKKKRTPSDENLRTVGTFKSDGKKREEVGEANVLMSKNPTQTLLGPKGEEEEEEEKAPAPISMKEKRERQTKREEQVKFWRVREEREARETRLAARRRLINGSDTREARERASATAAISAAAAATTSAAASSCGTIERTSVSRLGIRKSVKFNLKKNKTIEIDLK